MERCFAFVLFVGEVVRAEDKYRGMRRWDDEILRELVKSKEEKNQAIQDSLDYPREEGAGEGTFMDFTRILRKRAPILF